MPSGSSGFFPWRLWLAGIPLRVALIVPFFLLVLSAASLKGCISHHTEHSTVEDLTGQLLLKASHRVEQSLASYLGTARQLLQTNVAALRLGLLDPRNPSLLEAYFFQQLLAFPTINGVMLTNEQKDFLITSRWDKGLAVRVYNGDRRDGLHNYRVDAQGQRQGLIWLDTQFDPHDDPPGYPWYAAIKKVGKPHWRLVVGEIEADQPFLILGYMTPFDDSRGELAGVTAVSLYLTQVGDFLRGLQIGQTGQAFIVDHDGLLIATSTGEPPFRRYVASDKADMLQPEKQRLSATDSQSPLTRAASRYLADTASGFQRLTDDGFFKVTFNDQTHFVRIVPFSDANLDWRIVVVVPEADVMGGIHATEHQMAALNGAVLILALLLGLWITRLVTRPIRALNADVSRLVRSDFLESPTTSPIASSIAELRQLSDAFNSMATRLRESFSALHELNQALADHQEHLEEIVAQRTKALHLSEIQFRHAFELIGVGMILVSPSGHVLRVNNAFCQLLGYSEAELLELNFAQISFPDDLEKDWDLVRQVLSGAITRYQLEKRYVHKQGHAVWCLLNSSLVRDSDGQPLYGVGQVQDITERRRMEQALRDANQRLEQRVKKRTAELERTVALLERESAARQESEERLTLALRAAHAGAWEWNIATGQAFWTDDHYRLMGLAPGSVAVCYEAWLNCVHPDDRAEIAKRVTETLERDTEFSVEYRVVWPDGSIHWLSNTGQVQYDPAGQPVVMYGIQIDITARKRAELALRETETLYRQLVENQPDLICRFLPDTTLTFVNAAYARFFGQTPEELLGRRFIDFLDPPARAEVWRHLAALTPTAPAEQYEHASAQADGMTHWHLWHDFATFDDQGRVISFQSIGVDITVLKQSEERTRLFFERQVVGMAVTSPEKRWLQVNDRLCAMLGYSREELTHLTWAELTHPEDLAANLAQFERLLAGDTDEYTLEKRFIRKDRQVIDVNLTVACVRRPDGSVDYFLALLEDITERKRMEASLRQSEERMRLFFERQVVGMAIVSLEKQWLQVNDRFCAILGYSREELHDLTWFELTYPEDRAASVAQFERLRAGDIDNFTLEKRYLRKDGQTIHAKVTATCVRNKEGSVDYLIALLEDITERKQAEESLRDYQQMISAIVETSQDWIWTLNLAGHHTYSNPAVEQILRYSPAEAEQIGMELIHPEDRWIVDSQWPEWIQGRRGWNNLVLRWRRKDGTYRYLESSAVPILGPDGELRGFRGVDRDITEREETEQALRDALERLEQEIQTRRDQEAQLLQARKLEAIGQLTGGIAHDFNNLLTVVKGNLELLRDASQTSPDSEQTLLIEDALSAARQGAELTAGLLAFSRQRPLQPKRTRVALILQGLERLMERVLGPTITLRVVADSTLPDVLTDPSQFQAALMNLLINAQDAMPDGGVLDIRAGVILVHPGAAPPVADLAPGQYLVVTVADSGIGMDADTLARACEPFFTTKPVGKGTGLGLSTVYGFAAQSQGGLTLESQPGQGTTVRLFLPALEPSSGRLAEPPPAPRPVPSSLADGTVTLLVVEDESRVRRLACRYLRELGYTVLEAADAEEALAILETEPEIQLVFSDIVMPGELNGYDLARWIAAHRPEVKCLLTTGYHDQARAPAGDTLPPVLAKPYGKEQLADQIRQQFDNP